MKINKTNGKQCAAIIVFTFFMVNVYGRNNNPLAVYTTTACLAFFLVHTKKRAKN